MMFTTVNLDQPRSARGVHSCESLPCMPNGASFESEVRAVLRAAGGVIEGGAGGARRTTSGVADPNGHPAEICSAVEAGRRPARHFRKDRGRGVASRTQLLWQAQRTGGMMGQGSKSERFGWFSRNRSRRALVFPGAASRNTRRLGFESRFPVKKFRKGRARPYASFSFSRRAAPTNAAMTLASVKTFSGSSSNRCPSETHASSTLRLRRWLMVPPSAC